MALCWLSSATFLTRFEIFNFSVVLVFEMTLKNKTSTSKKNEWCEKKKEFKEAKHNDIKRLKYWEKVFSIVILPFFFFLLLFFVFLHYYLRRFISSLHLILINTNDLKAHTTTELCLTEKTVNWLGKKHQATHLTFILWRSETQKTKTSRKKRYS